MNSKPLDLHLLYRTVCAKGGMEEVIARKAWKVGGWVFSHVPKALLSQKARWDCQLAGPCWSLTAALCLLWSFREISTKPGKMLKASMLLSALWGAPER